MAPSTTSNAEPSVSDDIRLLGRLLGDVIRADAGDKVFALIERVRQVAVAERRGGGAPIAELAAALTPPRASTTNCT